MPTTETAARTTAGLAAELRVSIMRLRRRLASERHPDNLNPDAGLSLSAMSVLGLLHRLGDLTVGQLAVEEQVKPPSMTRTVSCLEAGGYVTRAAHPDDGRQVVVALTELGRQRLLADREQRTAWLCRQLDDLSAQERDALRAVLPILERLSRPSL